VPAAPTTGLDTDTDTLVPSLTSLLCLSAVCSPPPPTLLPPPVSPTQKLAISSSEHLVDDGIQRIYDGGWDPSAQSGGSKSEQVKKCMDLEHCPHWLHLEPTHLPRSASSRVVCASSSATPA
jgi:hypothetical protein